jgi:hypothetical protein
LNTASTRLISASHISATPASVPLNGQASAAATPPTARLVSGPAAAISASARGLGGSPPSSAMPPSIHSVIRSTFMP